MAAAAQKNYDVVVIGGGAKGSAIARDAVGRGLSVLLCEQGDLGDSCIKFLACKAVAAFQTDAVLNRQMTKEARKEWRILRRTVPHLTEEEAQIMPPASTGFMRFLSGAREDRRVRNMPPLNSVLSGHRFVMLNLRDAAERGATILPQTRFISGKRRKGRWLVHIRRKNDPAKTVLTTRILVDTTDGQSMPSVVEKPENAATVIVQLAIFKAGTQQPQKAVTKETRNIRLFAIPLQKGCLLCGSIRDVTQPPPTGAVIQQFAEKSGNGVGRLLWQGQTELHDVVLTGPAKAELESYHIHIETDEGKVPLFQIRGGTVSAARKLAEDTVAEMAPYTHMIGKKWTKVSALPGGDFQPQIRHSLIAELAAEFPFLAAVDIGRLFNSYGTESRQLLKGAKTVADLGPEFGAGLFSAEVRWLMQTEWAQTAEDVIWRRSRLGQEMDQSQIERLAKWLDGNTPAPQAGPKVQSN